MSSYLCNWYAHLW